MFSFFSRKSAAPSRPLVTDMHSHLLPGVDDGAQTPEQSFAILDHLISLGYEKIITTPHIMSDYYGNTHESLTSAMHAFEPRLREAGYTIPFTCAAEYYLDENLYSLVNNKQPLLTFGDRYLLFETNVISEPYQIKEFIFSLTTQGYKPVLAHPERYQYMTLEKAEDLRDRGVLLQINLLSLTGFYGVPMQKLAERLIERSWVDLLGSDCHTLQQAQLLNKVQQSRSYRKALDLPLINYFL
ncbi:MAG TPA: capsular biosynthesis protein [Cyclobacteriaceae bacterium]|nr:capsular biosynthesis protein [Cyclobacteriaceae bacterium]